MTTYQVSAEFIARDILALDPPDSLAARAHLLIGRSRIAHLDSKGAAEHAGLAAITGDRASEVASLRAMASLIRHPIMLELPNVTAATAFRFPGADVRRGPTW